MNNSFGKRIRAWRLELGLTQNEIGKRAGIDPSAIAHYESGRRTPSFESIVRLARAFDVTIDSFFGIENTQPRIKNLSQLDLKEVEIVQRVVDGFLALKEKEK